MELQTFSSVSLVVFCFVDGVGEIGDVVKSMVDSGEEVDDSESCRFCLVVVFVSDVVGGEVDGGDDLVGHWLA